MKDSEIRFLIRQCKYDINEVHSKVINSKYKDDYHGFLIMYYEKGMNEKKFLQPFLESIYKKNRIEKINKLARNRF